MASVQQPKLNQDGPGRAMPAGAGHDADALLAPVASMGQGIRCGRGGGGYSGYISCTPESQCHRRDSWCSSCTEVRLTGFTGWGTMSSTVPAGILAALAGSNLSTTSASVLLSAATAAAAASTSSVPSAVLTMGQQAGSLPAEILALLNASFARESEIVELKENLNYFFLLICSILIFIMQTGFSFLEAGMIRTKNTVNIMLKNTLDTYISVMVYWAVGFAFAKGEGNSFAGQSWWFGTFPEEKLAKWYYEFCFACTAATIVSGALAERCGFYAYLIYSSCITGIVYPIVSRWVWYTNEEGGGQGGWLADGRTVVEGIEMQDFSGSGVVHLVAGSCALAGALFIGPRIGRFDEDGNVVEIPGHSSMLAALGIFILMFGFFGFNGGSVLIITDPHSGLTMGRAIVNTMMSAAASALSSLILYKFVHAHRGGCCKTWKKSPWNFMNLLNGTLCGMAAICAGCDVMDMWGSFCTGFIVGCIFTFLQWFVTYKLKIDDPCDVIAIHFGSGLWGLIAAPLFDAKRGILVAGDRRSGLQLAVNLAGAAAIIAWSFGACCIIFCILKYSRLLRVDPTEEIKGMDIAEHGIAAYPSEAYGDGWGPSVSADLRLQCKQLSSSDLELSATSIRKAPSGISCADAGSDPSSKDNQTLQNLTLVCEQDGTHSLGDGKEAAAFKLS